MNKFGLISCILTFFLLFFSYIPLGWFYIEYLPWIGPKLKAHVIIPIPLFNYRNNRIFMWGMITADGRIRYWAFFNILTFIFLSVLTLVAGITAAIGFAMETEKGKKLIMYNNNALIIIIIYALIGMSIYSNEIFGKQFLFDTFIYIDLGFIILLVDQIFALLAYVKHPLD